MIITPSFEDMTYQDILAEIASLRDPDFKMVTGQPKHEEGYAPKPIGTFGKKEWKEGGQTILRYTVQVEIAGHRFPFTYPIHATVHYREARWMKHKLDWDLGEGWYAHPTEAIVPSDERILGHLLTEAGCGYPTFDEYCSHLGGNEDSIRQRETWIACLQMLSTMYCLFRGNLARAMELANNL